jgi:hypothetical protein
MIGWSKQKKYYYGVQFGKNANPNNLWKTYFTSSNNVKKFIENYGDPDIIEIRKTFLTPCKARAWETKVIQRMNLVENQNWLNKTDNTSKFYFEGPRGPRSKEHTEKLRKSHIGKKITAEHKEKLHTGRRNSKNTPEHTAAILKAVKGKKHTEKSRKNMADAYAKRDIEEVKNNASNAGKKSAALYKNDPERQAAHSERMKMWWAARGQLLSMEGQ